MSKYHSILRRHLPISDDEIVAVSMALGFPNMELVKRFDMPRDRRSVDDIVMFLD